MVLSDWQKGCVWLGEKKKKDEVGSRRKGSRRGGACKGQKKATPDASNTGPCTCTVCTPYTPFLLRPSHSVRLAGRLHFSRGTHMKRERNGRRKLQRKAEGKIDREDIEERCLQTQTKVSKHHTSFNEGVEKGLTETRSLRETLDLHHQGIGLPSWSKNEPEGRLSSTKKRSYLSAREKSAKDAQVNTKA